jgi:ABC-2 type transport system permease protein
MALIFIGTFLAATLFAFFWVETFFARGIADVRPLFSWMPVLMIFLVAALTMRQWSEEQRAGTLEILLTLPVSSIQLVLGKFLAVVILIVIALALTISLPITVTLLGNLDWGPVIGGYLAAVLLAAAYAAIGLFVSSRTDNQIVSLISTVLLCGILYLVGTAGVTEFFGNEVGEILRAFGAGSRFESIERGVIDVRDLLYYLTLTGIFLTLNVLSLKSKAWSEGERTRPKRIGVTLTSVLLSLNLILANIWIYPLRGLRIDMTQYNQYSLSRTTRDLLTNLQEPLLIRGYFSEKTHPLLAPLVPRIRDMLREYEIASGGMVQLDIVDPAQEPEKEAEANQVYGIRPTPFQVAGRYEASVINSYFDLLIRYGDQNVVLGFQDLIEVQPASDGTIDVQLRNLEYDLTSAIKKVVYGFQSIDAVLASLQDPVTLTLYVTPNTLPEPLAEAPATIDKVVQEIATESDGKVRYEVVNPNAPESPVTKQELFDEYGIQPIAVSLFSNETYYLYIVMTIGEENHVIYPSGEVSESEVRTTIESALKRATPGFLTVVGVWTPPATPTQDMFGQMQQPINSWQQLQETLRQEYEVRTMDLTTGQVPADVDVLVVVAPQNMSDKERYAIDQYLMRGGAVIMAAGNYTIAPDQYQGGIMAQPVTDGAQELLASYGITVEQSLVLDPQNEPFPVPVVREVSGFQVQEILALDYPFFVNIQPDGMAESHPIVSNLPAVTLNWTSPITGEILTREETDIPQEVTVLLESSSASWLQSDANIQPDQETYPEYGFPVGSIQKSYPLAVAVQGVFESAFKDQPSPFEQPEEEPEPAEGAAPTPAPPAGGTIPISPETARLVVVGSAEFVDDIVFELSSTLSGERYLNSLKLVQNAIAWATEDLDLLNIRARGTTARLLRPMGDDEQSFWEIANYAFALAAVVVLGIIWNVRRKNEPQIELVKAASKPIDRDAGTTTPTMAGTDADVIKEEEE